MTLVENRSHRHGTGSTGSPAERFTSRDPHAFPDPSSSQEGWRFSPLARIRPLFQDFTPSGQIRPEVSAPPEVGYGFTAKDDGLMGQALQPADRVSALAWTLSPRAALVQIPAEADLATPVVVRGVGEGGPSAIHLVVDVGAHARGTVVLHYSGSMTVAENVEIIVGDGAQVEVVAVYDWASDAVHLATHAVRVGRDASVKHVVVNLGGAVVRVAPSVQFAGPGGAIEMSGVSFAGDDQHFETRLYVDHAQPNCRSNVLYKNALQGERARTVWIGDVRIRPDATGTDTYEMNRNLLLSDGARADSVPNLEIETGNIAGAGHASATGRFDDLQLFYLQSRGIPEAEARRLVVRGFFADVVERIGIPDLEQQIMAAIEARLGYVPETDSEIE